MKDQLTIQDLSIYLPYKMKVLDTITDEPKVMNLGKGASSNWVGIKTVLNYFESGNGIYKPLLFPIECINQEITVNGETFVPIEKIPDKYPTLSFDTQMKRIFEEPRWINVCDYLLVIELCNYKIDINNLIGRGLAEDARKYNCY